MHTCTKPFQSATSVITYVKAQILVLVVAARVVGINRAAYYTGGIAAIYIVSQLAATHIKQAGDPQSDRVCGQSPA